MLRVLMKDVPTDYVACVVDPKGKTFRSEIYPDYKANRPPMPEDLSVQIPLIFEGVQKEGIPFLQVPGIEADDTIGTLTKKAVEEGFNVVIATGENHPVHALAVGLIQDLLDDGHVVIACGGGGIPIVRTREGDVQGVSAVIDKDFAACMLATCMQADTLLILTAVEKVAINFGKEDELWLDYLTPETAQKYIDNGQFASGSMLPKVQAALQFAMSLPGRQAVITHLNKALDGIRGITGTQILAPCSITQT